MILAVTVSRIVKVVIVRMSMCVLSRKCGLLKNMMDTMGRRGRKKKHKKGDYPHGADGAAIAEDCSHCIDNYL
jgi:hypothetical protein